MFGNAGDVVFLSSSAHIFVQHFKVWQLRDLFPLSKSTLWKLRVCHNHLRNFPQKWEKPYISKGHWQYLSIFRGPIFPCNEVLMVDPGASFQKPMSTTLPLPIHRCLAGHWSSPTCATETSGDKTHIKTAPWRIHGNDRFTYMTGWFFMIFHCKCR